MVVVYVRYYFYIYLSIRHSEVYYYSAYEEPVWEKIQKQWEGPWNSFGNSKTPPMFFTHNEHEVFICMREKHALLLQLLPDVVVQSVTSIASHYT